MTCVAAAAFAVAAVSASAGDQSDPNPTCGVSTPEMVECLNASRAQWDKRLNAGYRKALDAAQSDRQREQLRKAQRLWVEYRDANCLYYDLDEGTIARIEAADCLYRMTRARAEEFEGKTDRN